MIAKTNEFHASSALFRAPEGRVLAGNMQSEGKMGAVLFDSDLHVPILIPKAVDNRPQFLSTTGETFVKQNQHVWVAYKMGPPPERIREGIGAVLSVSNEAVAYLDQGTVHIEGMDGKPLGMFALKARPTIRFVGHDRLWVESGSEVEIADFNGKLIQTLEKPDGWGFRIGQSSDGSRILYDRYTRHISLAQKAEEDAVAVVTLGVGVGDEGANAEMVQVIDTRSGKKCFEWNSRKNLLVAGQFHADIDPSGRLIAIMNRTALNIYRSPETCIEK
ncbi:MAG: hypothetical protein ABSG02_00415 [Terriglobales bacterium]